MCSMLLKLGSIVHGHLRQEIPLPLSGLARDSNLLGKYSHQTADPGISRQDVGSWLMGNAQASNQ